uniref:50S ribosomal protein L16ic n=1 Tax=Rhizophora mucronata TaxID=61149 RepID=A0A2P2QVE5_RHIMU
MTATQYSGDSFPKPCMFMWVLWYQNCWEAYVFIFFCFSVISCHWPMSCVYLFRYDPNGFEFLKSVSTKTNITSLKRD